jgi:hypothetical protein
MGSSNVTRYIVRVTIREASAREHPSRHVSRTQKADTLSPMTPSGSHSRRDRFRRPRGPRRAQIICTKKLRDVAVRHQSIDVRQEQWAAGVERRGGSIRCLATTERAFRTEFPSSPWSWDALTQTGERLAHEELIAAGDLVQVFCGPSGLPCKLADRALRERREKHSARARARQVANYEPQRAARAHFVISIRDDAHCGSAMNAAPQEHEQIERRFVRRSVEKQSFSVHRQWPNFGLP